MGHEETISGASKRGFGARDRQIAEKSCKRWQGRGTRPNESFVENETGERSSHASTKRPDKGLGFDGKQSDGEVINGAAFAFLRGSERG